MPVHDPYKKGTKYRLLFKPYDDVTYEDEKSRAVLSLHSRAGKIIKPQDELEREFGIVPVLNMHEADDRMETGPNCIFRDAEWSDFDQDFIKMMMEKPEDESTAVVDPENYPVHDPKLATSDIDKAFNLEMEGFDDTYNIELGDERTAGALDISNYKAALDEWQYNRHPRLNFLSKYKGKQEEISLIAKPRAIKIPQGDVFHRNMEGGVFLTVLQNKKNKNMYVDYFSQRNDAVSLTKGVIHNDPDEGMAPEIDEDEVIEEMCPPKVEEPFDCQTILSTYSNLENHPEIIRETLDPNRKIRISRKSGLPKVVGFAGDSQNGQIVVNKDGVGDPQNDQIVVNKDDVGDCNSDNSDDEDDYEDDRDERLSILTSQASHSRPKNETPEERKERKALLKELRRLQRERKKDLKYAFKVEGINMRFDIQQADTQRHTLSLGAIKT